MTNEELLLKDLTARLPYNVKFPIIDWNDDIQEEVQVNATLYSINKDGYVRTLESDYEFDITSIKPYLLPASSMTEEQKSYINGRWGVNKHFEFEIDPLWGEYFVDLCDAVGFINWCYENHFDINGLIPRGLAIDATDKINITI
jgi:hypothetical protein